MTDLAVSIIVVSLNTKKDFLKTLNSILSQKFSSYEIIVIDGDSKDGTIEEIEKNKRNIKYKKIKMEESQKGYEAMVNFYAKNLNTKPTQKIWQRFWKT